MRVAIAPYGVHYWPQMVDTRAYNSAPAWLMTLPLLPLLPLPIVIVVFALIKFMLKLIVQCFSEYSCDRQTEAA